jgi:hypothetical protein
MNYTRFKINRLQRNTGLGYHKVNLNLTDLTIEGKTYVADGEAYTCTLVALNGKYLPQVIDITGTTSRYAFKYDYTTGVIYIPSSKIYNDITIIAEASDVNNNIPAVLDVQMRTSTTTDGVDDYSEQTFLKIDVFPSRGSKVIVEYAGVKRTVEGDLSTTSYNSGTAKEVIFGTFNNKPDQDGVTQTSGRLTISGAYDAYRSGVFTHYNKGTSTSSSFITNIVEKGSIRYLPSYFVCNLSVDLTFDKELDYIGSSAFYTNSGSHTSSLILNRLPKAILGSVAGSSSSSSDSEVNLYFNNVKWDDWVSGNRDYYTERYNGAMDNKQYIYINGERIDSIEEITLSNNVTSVGSYAFNDFNGLTNITIPNSVHTINDHAFYCCGSLTNVFIGNFVTTIGYDAFSACPSLTTVVMHSKTPPLLQNALFDTTALKEIIVPNGCGNDYKASWNQYASYIVEASA